MFASGPRGAATSGNACTARGLFTGIEWGSAQVLAQTRRRLRRLRWQWTELRTLWDVDRPEDVLRLRRSRVLERQ